MKTILILIILLIFLSYGESKVQVFDQSTECSENEKLTPAEPSSTAKNTQSYLLNDLLVWKIQSWLANVLNRLDSIINGQLKQLKHK